ncbi:MAG: hypothetical protein B7Z80_10325 [Rhodospirillales bacterium 20-64-7]|nr:MAG: hypothetical protein B7Z80_10325 [Rhodospirillales bacterium 20-64-7]
MSLQLLVAKALRVATERHLGQGATPIICNDIKRAVLADLAAQGHPLWHAAHRIRVEFIDGRHPNIVIPPELLKLH